MSESDKIKDSDFDSDKDEKKNIESFEKQLDKDENKKQNDLSEITTSKKDERQIGFGQSNIDISKNFQEDNNNNENVQKHQSEIRRGTGRPRGRNNSNNPPNRNNFDNRNNNNFDNRNNNNFDNRNNNNFNNDRNNNNYDNNRNNYNDNRQRGFNFNDNRYSGHNNFNRGNRNFNRNFGNRNYERSNFNNNDGRRFYNNSRMGNYRNSNFNDDNFYYENKMKEKEKENQTNPRIENIKNEYKDIILTIEKIYSNSTENEIALSLDSIQQKTSQTIFESMNDIYCNNSIQFAKKYYKKRNNIKPFLDNYELNIFEQINLKYLSNAHKEILQFYKVYSFDDKKNLNLKFPDSFYYEKKEDRRRILKKNEDGIYNYIPILCKFNHDNENDKENCNYSHNEYETKFHSLIYKTKRCTKKECENESNPELCCNSHNFENDFRIIYNYLDDNIIELMCKFESKFKKKIRTYEQCYKNEEIEESNFDLNTFKILECNTEYTECDKDYHLCFFYHNITERRRPPKLFRYCSLICDNVFSNGKFYPDSCVNKDYCHYCHNYYEFYYHEDNFRKVIPCLREKKNDNSNECIYYETCYGYHNNTEQFHLKNKEKSQQEIMLDEYKRKYEILKEKINHFGCLNCGKLPKNKIFYLIKKYHNKKEMHFLCNKCKAKCNNICPICNTKIDENDYIEISLEPNNNNKE